MEDLPEIKESIFEQEGVVKKSLTDKSSMIVLVFGCLITGVIIYSVTPIQEGLTDLWGNTVSEKKVRESFIKTLFIFIPIFSFLLGLLTSLIPYKKKRYREKYISFSLLTLLGVYSLMLILRIISLL